MAERIITIEPGQRLTILAAPRPSIQPRIPPPKIEARPLPITFPEGVRLPPWVPPQMVMGLPPRRPTAVGETRTQLLGALGILDMIRARVAAIRSRWLGQIEYGTGHQHGYDYQVLPEEFGIESR